MTEQVYVVPIAHAVGGLRHRWLLPVEILTKNQLEACGGHAVNASKYEVRVDPSENPVLIPECGCGNHCWTSAIRALEKDGTPYEFVPWDARGQCWIDHISGTRMFPATADSKGV